MSSNCSPITNSEISILRFLSIASSSWYSLSGLRYSAEPIRSRLIVTLGLYLMTPFRLGFPKLFGLLVFLPVLLKDMIDSYFFSRSSGSGQQNRTRYDRQSKRPSLTCTPSQQLISQNVTRYLQPVFSLQGSQPPAIGSYYCILFFRSENLACKIISTNTLALNGFSATEGKSSTRNPNLHCKCSSQPS